MSDKKTTGQIKFENTEKQGTPEHGFAEGLKTKWQAHVEKNKAKAAARDKQEKAPVSPAAETAIKEQKVVQGDLINKIKP